MPLRRTADAADPDSADRFAWNGVYPEIHSFCATDLSAFYFDIRKDALYCDRPDSLRRRAARTVLDILHRSLCAWLAPALAFTAEEAWLARFPDEDGSVHLLDFPFVPEGWKDDALAAKWARIRELRGVVTAELEKARAAGTIGSSLQAAPVLSVPAEDAALLIAETWAETCITSDFVLAPAEAPAASFAPAPGAKCARCWRVLPEVGRSAKHPTLCLRCEDAVEALS